MNQSTFELQLGLGKSLALARKAEGLTQAELADEAGLSRATIAKIEAGEADPKLSTIGELAWALDLSPAWLLMSEQDIEVLGEMTESDSVNRFLGLLPDELISRIGAMARSGRKKKVIQALSSVGAALGGAKGSVSDLLEKAKEKAPTESASTLGAMAIGTSLSPGLGTAVGAAWGKIQSRFEEDEDEEE